jgi:hypothetical protein
MIMLIGGSNECLEGTPVLRVGVFCVRSDLFQHREDIETCNSKLCITHEHATKR